MYKDHVFAIGESYKNGYACVSNIDVVGGHFHINYLPQQFILINKIAVVNLIYFVLQSYKKALEQQS